MRRCFVAFTVVATLSMAGAAMAQAGSLLDFSPAEVAAILRHGPWPVATAPDPSNRLSGTTAGEALGQRLFFDAGLSANGRIACVSCHHPPRAFTDARATSTAGLAAVDRNAPALLNLRLARWYGWDGAHDNLWSQSLRPILDPREMGRDAAAVAAYIRAAPALAACYERAVGAPPSAQTDETVLVGVGKALAAFLETLVTPATPFDEFREALGRGDRLAAARYPLSAQRGLRIFIGNGNCTVCHFGPAFTNGEFADIGVPYFIAPGRVDAGRHAGIKRVQADPHNLLSHWNDDPARADATSTRHVEATQRNFGEFRVPSLRNVARTAPYMHNGSLTTLRDVVRHYSELNEERLHADGERILKPLKLTAAASADLVAFLESLSAPLPGVHVTRRHPAGACRENTLSKQR